MPKLILKLVLILVWGAAAAREPKFPDTSHDGLLLQHDTQAAAVYLAPDASLAGYTKVILLDCQVAFQKNWRTDENLKAVTNRQLVTANDMERIRQALSERFSAVFRDELENQRGYEIVTEPGPDVLIVKPAIIDLIVTVPAVRPSAQLRSERTSAGAMTLYAELYDAETGAIIARVIDPQVSKDANFETQGARITNKQEADKILRLWAGRLGSHMGSGGR